MMPELSRQSLNNYGSLEPLIRDIRAHRPLDLNAERWRQTHSDGQTYSDGQTHSDGRTHSDGPHPGGTFAQWQQQARACLLDGLHYDPGPLELRPEVLAREERAEFVLETVAFNTTPWIRVKGHLLLPKGIPYPVPGLVVFHAWGGPMLFGKERLVNTGRDHPLLLEHRNKVYSGRFLAGAFVKQGYAVIVIDAHHFGERAPRGLNGIPASYDPFALSIGEYVGLDTRVRDQLYLGVRQLNWAGTTWMGVNYWDDSRCVDYLCSRPEVDAARIGCTGLSVGGWRANFMAALDPRIKASVSVGWMTTGDYQQVYNLAGAVGTFCLLPGVWDRMDVPDLTIMAAPNASMVVSGSEDRLFPPEGQQEAARQIAAGYTWAGCADKFRLYHPPKPHCYDAEIQQAAFAWLEAHLK